MLNISDRQQAPASPSVFFGRAQETAALISLLSGDGASAARRVAILGPPGVGKTSLALHALHDPILLAQFGDRRYFIRCDSAPDGGSFRTIMATMLNVVAANSSLLPRAIRRFLAKTPTLLILDNFESIWDDPNQRREAEALLSELHDVPSLNLIITLRGAERPLGVHWTRPFLPPLCPLSDDAAAQAFLAICDGSGGNDVDRRLLSLVDNLPLGIVLLACMAQYESWEILLQRWEHEHTSMLQRGSDRLSNLDVSISLSVNCHRVNQFPETLSILKLLSLLPDGLEDAMISQFFDSTENVGRGVSALLHTSLAYRDSNRVRVLSPIRSYVLRYNPPPETIRTSVREYYCNLIDNAAASYMTVTWPEHRETFLQESGNAMAAIELAISRDSDLKSCIRAVAQWFELNRSSGREPVALVQKAIDRATATAEANGDNDLLAECLLSGRKKQPEKALSLFESTGNIAGQIRCLVWISERGSSEQCDKALHMARTLQDVDLQISALLALGRCKSVAGDPRSAMSAFQTALELVPSAKIRPLGKLMNIYREMATITSRRGNIVEGIKLINLALQSTRMLEVDPNMARLELDLGCSLLEQCSYSLAVTHLRVSAQIFDAVDQPQWMVAAQGYLGIALIGSEKPDEGCTQIEEALTCVNNMKDRMAWHRGLCEMGFGHWDVHQREFKGAMARFRHAAELFRQFPNSANSAWQCHADAAILDGNLDEAQTTSILAVAIARSVWDKHAIIVALNTVAEFFLYDNEWQTAEAVSHAVLPLATFMQIQKLRADCYLRIGISAYQTGDTAIGRRQCKRAMDIYTEASLFWLRAEAQSRMDRLGFANLLSS